MRKRPGPDKGRAMGKEAFETGSYGDYISLGLLADRDTEACRYAEEIRKKLNAGREVKNIEMGQLAAAVYAEALGVGEKRTAEEQEAPENDLGDELQLGTNSATSKKVLTDDFSRRIIIRTDIWGRFCFPTDEA